MTFHPCRAAPHDCPLATQANAVRFHSWAAAYTFARRRAAGQKTRFRVRHDGAHWVPINLATGDDT